MPKLGSTHNLLFDFFRATTLASRCFLVAIVLVFSGCSSSVQSFDPDSGPRGDGPTSTVEHDIAPWDGPAFGLWIPAGKFGGKPDSWIYLRIWDAIEKSERKFVFPDKSMKMGSALYFLDLKSPRSLDWSTQRRHELNGWVRFITANRKQPVVGEFDFSSEDGVSLNGRFEAEWTNKNLLDKAEQREAAESR